MKGATTLSQTIQPRTNKLSKDLRTTRGRVDMTAALTGVIDQRLETRVVMATGVICIITNKLLAEKESVREIALVEVESPEVWKDIALAQKTHHHPSGLITNRQTAK